MFKFKLNGVNDIINELDKMNKEIDRVTKREVTAFAMDVAQEARRLAPVDLGNLRSGITYEVVDTSDGAQAKIKSTAPHAWFAEFGTKSKFDANIPAEWIAKAEEARNHTISDRDFDVFVNDISEWAKRKGIPDEAHGAIIWSILKYGRSSTPYMRPAYEKCTPRFRENLRLAIDAVYDEFNR